MRVGWAGKDTGSFAEVGTGSLAHESSCDGSCVSGSVDGSVSGSVSGSRLRERLPAVWAGTPLDRRSASRWCLCNLESLWDCLSNL